MDELPRTEPSDRYYETARRYFEQAASLDDRIVPMELHLHGFEDADVEDRGRGIGEWGSEWFFLQIDAGWTEPAEPIIDGHLITRDEDVDEHGNRRVLAVRPVPTRKMSGGHFFANPATVKDGKLVWDRTEQQTERDFYAYLGNDWRESDDGRCREDMAAYFQLPPPKPVDGCQPGECA